MKRDDLISKARLIARIDAPEEGSLDESAILNLIAEIADENDRLETEVADVENSMQTHFCLARKPKTKKKWRKKRKSKQKIFSICKGGKKWQ